MDADFSAALGAVMGVKWVDVDATFDTIIVGLQAGKYDVGNSSFTVTALREKQVNFVTYFQAGEGYYVPKSSSLKLNGLMSLCGHTVAVETGTTEQTDANSAVGLCKKADKKADTVLAFSTQNEANLAIASGRAQIGFADSQVAGYIVVQAKGQFKLDGPAFGVAPYGFALREVLEARHCDSCRRQGAHQRRHLRQDPRQVGSPGRRHQEPGDRLNELTAPERR